MSDSIRDCMIGAFAIVEKQKDKRNHLIYVCMDESGVVVWKARDSIFLKTATAKCRQIIAHGEDSLVNDPEAGGCPTVCWFLCCTLPVCCCTDKLPVKGAVLCRIGSKVYAIAGSGASIGGAEVDKACVVEGLQSISYTRNNEGIFELRGGESITNRS